MLGHDVEYSTKLGDMELLNEAKKEQRTLLTRDFMLYKHAIARGIDAYYLEGKTEPERLAELAKRFSIELRIDMTTSRCPKCNTALESAPKEEIADRVEGNTLEHYDEFWMCPKCGKVYWQGAHWTKIRETLEKAQKHLTILN